MVGKWSYNYSILWIVFCTGNGPMSLYACMYSIIHIYIYIYIYNSDSLCT